MSSHHCVNNPLDSNGATELVHLMSGTIQRSHKNSQKFTGALIIKSGKRQLSLE